MGAKWRVSTQRSLWVNWKIKKCRKWTYIFWAF